ncbi:MAG: T9SS type A sorting domain-containing protein, partial [Ignavibacteriota bacterium]
SPELATALGDPSNPEPGSMHSTNDPASNGNEVANSLDVGPPADVLHKTLIYPNPARTSATVRLALSEPRNLAFSIHDLLGKRVLEAGNLTATSAGDYEKDLNISELPAGVYLLVITTDKGEQNMQRLVIEK